MALVSRWISQNATIRRHPLVRRRARAEGAFLEGAGAGEGEGGAEWIGWGYKASGLWAKKEAEKRGAGFRLFEDGFVRSLRPGYGAGALYSLVEDGSGIYYDGTGRSDLVAGLNGEGWIGEALGEEGWREEAREDLRRYRVVGASKYNWFPGEFDAAVAEGSVTEPGVLVVDQTEGDASVRYGGVGEEGFATMLEAALDENPGMTVYVRGHPDHAFRAKRSCLSSPLLADRRVRMVDARLAPWQVFERAHRVYVATSLMGLEAILHGVEVVTFGCPFYAGWGLTEDRNSRLPERARKRSREEVFQAALRCYSRYFDPDTLEPCSLGRILDHLELQKERFRENARTWVTFGMSPWKRPLMGRYLASPSRELRHTRSRRRLRRWVAESPGAAVLVWGSADPGNGEGWWRVEDGFLRSAGLGAEFHTPLSLVFDSTGIYYNGGAPCDLASVLQERTFTARELKDAGRLVDTIVGLALTKYNLVSSGEVSDWPRGAEGAKRVLVPGQVEGDASIIYGSPRWKTNLELLREVRRREPEAVIAYKPHPDVVKRLRPGKSLTREVMELCDAVVESLDILPWLESCDAVHTMTSLAGFEALLRGKTVTCYGMPFYAGWGLTQDVVPVVGRKRRLSLEELVAGALLLYPRYLNPATGEFTTAFGAADLIARRGAPLFSRPGHLRMLARLKSLVRRRS